MPYEVNIKETQKLTGNITIGERGEQGPAGPQGERGEPGGAYITQQSITNTSGTLSLLSNVFYIIENTYDVGLVRISLTGEQSGLCNEFLGQLTTTSPTVFSFPEGTQWLTNDVEISNNAFVAEAQKTYFFSIVNGFGVVSVYE